MFKNVLIPTLLDDEQRLKTALKAGKKMLDKGGTITLLNVVEDFPTYVETYLPADVLTSNTEEVLELLKNAADSAGEDVQTRVVRGHSGRTILKEAESMGADMVIISSHRPDLTDYFLGSTAGHVVRHARCPVLVLR